MLRLKIDGKLDLSNKKVDAKIETITREFGFFVDKFIENDVNLQKALQKEGKNSLESLKIFSKQVSLLNRINFNMLSDSGKFYFVAKTIKEINDLMEFYDKREYKNYLKRKERELLRKLK